MGHSSEQDSQLESSKHAGERSNPLTAEHVNPADLRSVLGAEQQRISQSAGSFLHEVEIFGDLLDSAVRSGHGTDRAESHTRTQETREQGSGPADVVRNLSHALEAVRLPSDVSHQGHGAAVDDVQHDRAIDQGNFHQSGRGASLERTQQPDTDSQAVVPTPENQQEHVHSQPVEPTVELRQQDTVSQQKNIDSQPIERTVDSRPQDTVSQQENVDSHPHDRSVEARPKDAGNTQEPERTTKTELDLIRNVADFSRTQFDKLDADHNGYIGKAELDKALKDPAAGKDVKEFLTFLRSNIENIQVADKDLRDATWGPEGMSRKDISEYTRKLSERPEYKAIQTYDQQVEGKRLRDDVDSRIPKPEDRAEFKRNMEEFEKRAKEQGLPPEEIAKTYKEVSRLLESKGEQPVSQADRVKLAKQIMDQTAHPTTIDQGYHNTCNVTTAEVLIYTKHPSDAAKLVADVATTGGYTASDGTQVKLDQKSLRPDAEAKPDKAGDGRSYATQLFNVVAVNLHYAKHNPNIHYENHPIPLNADKGDMGERLVDYSKKPPEVLTATDAKTGKTLPQGFDGMDADPLVEVHNTIIGKSDKDVLLGARLTIGDSIDGADNSATRFTSEQELMGKLAELKEGKKLPVIIQVHTGMEPFWKDSGGGAAGGSGGWHVVTVTDYEPGPSPKVAIDNQWGEHVDHSGDGKVNAHDLFLATLSPENVMDGIQEEVLVNKAHHQVDTYQNLELLRLQHVTGRISDGDYVKRLGETIAAAQPTWERQRQAGTFNEEAFTRVQQKFEDAYYSLPPEGKLKLLSSACDTPLMSEDCFNRSVAGAMAGLIQQRDQAQASGKLEDFQNKKYNPALSDFDKLLAKLPEERQQAIAKLISQFSTKSISK